MATKTRTTDLPPGVDMFTVKDVADILGCTRSYAAYLFEVGKIKHHKFPNRFRIVHRKDLLEYLKAQAK